MNKFVMYVGLPGSGKTEQARRDQIIYTEAGFIVVHLSSDDIREELYGSAEAQDAPHKIFELMLRRARAALKEDNTIVLYDATNLSSKRRMNVLKQLRQSCPDLECNVKIVLATLENCVYRNFKRERVVPFSVIMKMLKQFQCPHDFEGWDYINLVYTDWDEYIDLMTYADAARGFDQQCPSHLEDLWEHIEMTLEEYRKQFMRPYYTPNVAPIIQWALLYHDFGKLYTQTPKNSKGEEKLFKRGDIYLPQMHYYGHDCASSYLWLISGSAHSLLERDRKDDVIEIANIIQYHMEIIKRDNIGYARFIAQLPNSLIEEIEIVNMCDNAGRVPV